MTILNQEQLENVYQIISPNCNPKFLLEKFFPEAEFGDIDKWVDVHSKAVNGILALSRDDSIIYNNSKPITTHSQEKYGTVSLWWLIVFCSNYLHPHCIPTGEQIAIPSLVTINSYLTVANTGLSGKTIII